MMKTFLFIPTIFIGLWLSTPFEFNFLLTSKTEILTENEIEDCSHTIIGTYPELDFPPNYKVQTIVIDAGHGGRDGGCSGSNSKEKVLTLKIAKKLKAGLTRQFPNMNIYLTRDKDIFVPLHKRAKFANENKADLFLSIHCNYITKAAHIHGSESYVLGLHKAEANLDVAKRENDVVYLEEDYEQNYGVDPNSPAGHILLSAFQNANLEQSILFAEKIENRIKHQTPHKSRGVKQAGFYVLRETTMPSVLLETGYLSNKMDQAYLLTQKGQDDIVTSIIQALFDYKIQVEGNSKPNRTAYQPAPTIPKPTSVKVEPQPVKKVVKKAATPKPIPATKKVIAKEPTPKISTIEKNEVLVYEKNVNYKVQIAASKREINIKNEWKHLGYMLEVVEENKHLKYQIGGFSTFKSVQKALQNISAKGYKECFVVAYSNGRRISLSEAKVLSKE